MKKILFSIALFAAVVCGTDAVQAQQQGIAMPAASPAATINQKVGLTDITVQYSRPSLKGRKFGVELAPYGKLWRTGANASTKIKFSDDVTIHGNKVPAGEYALYTIPNQNEWTIVIHKNTTHWGDGGPAYKQEEDLARFTVKAQTNARAVETFTINFANLKTGSADVELLWDKSIATFTIETDVDSKVMAQIQERVVKGTDVTPGLYAAAASYYFENGKDLKLAADWMKKANAAEPRFWTLHTQAKIQAQLKDYKNAVTTAEKSLEMAKKEGNADYVRMNEDAIAQWKKMK
ncbi:DUF2911 domain-containing protein [Pontibacter sp. SGAir0037]|uniref:DUF2911 domain-containing protein n=1 Tax=Pontibacter sp. SGAir0037 TaxID=2571030 RepID=UPI0010CD444E|nr:DUF2911 domain-containing protein [Pontibacter sp. SGAir0037]QCR20917.1 hypothetical protein C1N53_00105 [Pontibacter sp. SGAir0037]